MTTTWIQKSCVLALSTVMLAGAVQAQPQLRGDDRGPQGRPDQSHGQPHAGGQHGPTANPARPAAPQGRPAAPDHRPNAQPPAQGPQHAQHPQRPTPPAHAQAQGHAQSHHRFERGQRLGQQYRSNQYVVDNWRAHRLQAPARGQHWVMVGGDYLLVSVATGVILSVLVGH